MNPQDARQHMLSLASRGTTATIDLAWMLAGAVGERMWAQFTDDNDIPFPNPMKWLAHDFGHQPGYRAAVTLMKAGRLLYPARDAIDDAVARGKLSAGRFKFFSKLVDQNKTTTDEIVAALECDGKVAAEIAHEADALRRPNLVFRFREPTTSLRAKAAITRFALAHGFRSNEEAMLAMVEAIERDIPIPAEFDKYADQIAAGTFRCRICKRIPLEPIAAPIRSAEGKLMAHTNLYFYCADPCAQIAHVANYQGKAA